MEPEAAAEPLTELGRVDAPPRRGRGAEAVPVPRFLHDLVTGDFVTTLAVNQTAEPGSLFRYEYTLTNQPTSDLPAVSFALSVAASANLQSLSGPTGWDVVYSTGETTVTWISTDPSFDLQPSTSGVFSFVSPLDSTLQEYLITGFSDQPLRIETNGDQIRSPGANVIPEPSSLMLLGIGLLGLFGYAWRRRRMAST